MQVRKAGGGGSALYNKTALSGCVFITFHY